jgi:hypothetical protein
VLYVHSVFLGKLGLLVTIMSLAGDGGNSLAGLANQICEKAVLRFGQGNIDFSWEMDAKETNVRCSLARYHD